MNLDIFRAYDIRGIFGVDFQPTDFYQIARAFVDHFQPKIVALGHDVRKSSPVLFQKVAEGLIDSGVKILNLGRISTDMLYFAVVHYQADGGIVISASHNPAEYNGMKLVRWHAAPISADTGLFDIRNAIENPTLSGKQKTHCRAIPEPVPFLDAYLKHLSSFTDLQKLSSKRIVINANSGLAGQIAERLLAETPIQICEQLFTQPDGTFSKIPAGRPDPLRPENRELTTEAVKRTKADLAVAWDADADRCFFFDEDGAFVEGCYITALLAEKLLEEKGERTVIFDPRAVWAVENAVVSANGTPLLNRCGHSFIKARMQETGALFAGEASGHYYFRENFYTDNGMIPLLLILEYLSANRTSLAESVNRFRSAYPVSGEINFSFETERHKRNAMGVVQQEIYALGNHPCIEMPVDGLSVRFQTGFRPLTANSHEHGNWRFNLRESNTEPLLRLNVEAIGSENLLIEQTMRVSEKLQSLGGSRETGFRWEKE
ncbi:MAG: phosphomannomutase/phosphoglucomutase [Candidatus Poribacteria bacterium]|nr:phosphomannomutase/phosphoglucomutase [Candidatus Poribacteria bacterium]